MRKFILYSDIDETLNDMIRFALPLYNQKCNDNLSFDDIIDYDISKFIKPNCENFFHEFITKDVLLQLNLEPYSKEVLDWVNEQDWIDFHFVTHGFIYGLEARDIWLKDKFDWYNDNYLWRITDKQKLMGDMLIEDSPYNLKNATYAGILLEKPYNRNIVFSINDKIYRCKNWSDGVIESILREAKRIGFR